MEGLGTSASRGIRGGSSARAGPGRASEMSAANVRSITCVRTDDIQDPRVYRMEALLAKHIACLD